MRKAWLFFILLWLVSFGRGFAEDPDKMMGIVPEAGLAMIQLQSATDKMLPLQSASACKSDNCLSWMYVLVAPYPTVQDGFSLRYLKLLWEGQPTEFVQTIIMAPATYQVFADRWGDASENTIQQVKADELLKAAWAEKNVWAIIPFDALDPRWKVIAVNGSSPLRAAFDPQNDPLTFFWEIPSKILSQPIDPPRMVSNFDPQRLTSLTLTGTTALVRRLAVAIEEQGTTFPVAGIADRVLQTDFLHISNEAPFFTDCPPGVPLRREARFCSLPEYFGVLEAIGVDLVELTGNHILDWGYEPFLNTLSFYQEKGLRTYGGGSTSDEGREPVFIEHHGNRIAILGCNAIGPENVFATSELPGASRCDLEWLKEKVSSLRGDGWLVVVTFQHLEYNDYSVVPAESHDFLAIARAGATLVSGSQAHVPQGFTFIDDSFIHYGLGNFLFDQTSQLERDSFFDRHYFYNGRYIGNSLETIRMEEDMQLRFLTNGERAALLELIFNTCSWNEVF